jgi:hypothetical protein
VWKGWSKGECRCRLKGRREPGRPCRRWNSQKLEQVISLILELEEKKKMNKVSFEGLLPA